MQQVDVTAPIDHGWLLHRCRICKTGCATPKAGPASSMPHWRKLLQGIAREVSWQLIATKQSAAALWQQMSGQGCYSVLLMIRIA